MPTGTRVGFKNPEGKVEEDDPPQGHPQKLRVRCGMRWPFVDQGRGIVICSSGRSFPRSYYLPNSVLGPGSTTVNQDEPCLPVMPNKRAIVFLKRGWVTRAGEDAEKWGPPYGTGTAAVETVWGSLKKLNTELP